VVLPSQVEINHHPGGILTENNIGIQITNPVDNKNNIHLPYIFLMEGGYDTGSFTTRLYLDTNDSYVLGESNLSIQNHSSTIASYTYD